MKQSRNKMVSPSVTASLLMSAFIALPVWGYGSQESAADDEASPAESVEKNADNSANDLNARQRIRQTFTVKRRINGTVVEETTIAVPDDARFPARETEAGDGVRQFVRDKVDREVLTRREAVDEADLEFTLADSNMDGTLTKEEYVALYETRLKDPNYTDFLTLDETAHKSSDGKTPTDRYAAFAAADRLAYRKAALGDYYDLVIDNNPTLNRQYYIRAYLNEFDRMDIDANDMITVEEMPALRHYLLTGQPKPDNANANTQ